MQTVDDEVKQLEARIHASFGLSSPFLEHNTTKSHQKCSPGSCESSRKAKSLVVNPMPTILQSSQLSGGALRATTLFTFDGDTINVESDAVNEKLQDAYFLRRARKLGHLPDRATLKNVSSLEMKEEIIKSLVQASFSKECSNQHDTSRMALSSLCKDAAIDLDKCIFDCALDLCTGKNISDDALTESCCLAHICSSSRGRAQIALVVLRAARSSGSLDPKIDDLSKKAKSWAGSDTRLHSEIEEATRLLHVDRIVIKYCGRGARELFLVQNPRHSMTLLGCVIGQVGKSNHVVSDILMLCSSFQHLSRVTAIRRLMSRALLCPGSEVCTKIFDELVDHDPKLGQEAVRGVLLHADETLSGRPAYRSRLWEDEAVMLSDRVRKIIDRAIEHELPFDSETLFIVRDSSSLDSIRSSFIRIGQLQKDHEIWLSLTDVSDRSVVMRTTSKVVASTKEQTMTTTLSREKAATALLVDTGCLSRCSDLLALSLLDHAKESLAVSPLEDIRGCLKILFDAGIFAEQTQQVLASLLHLLALVCEMAKDAVYNGATKSGPSVVLQIVALLQDWILRTCPNPMLSTICNLTSSLETTLHILSRCDDPLLETLEEERDHLRQQAIFQLFGFRPQPETSPALPKCVSMPCLHSTWQKQDGLLLPTRPALVKSLHFITVEGRNQKMEACLDIFRLVFDQGAHNLAMKLIFTTLVAPCSADSVLVHLDEVESLLSRVSCSMAERSFGGTGLGITSSIVDSQNALLFLVGMPMRRAFSMLGACLPSATNTGNYKRLHQLARLGAAASSLSGLRTFPQSPLSAIGWRNQEKFLRQCNALAKQAQWFFLLCEAGLSFDPQRLQTNSKSAKGKYAAALLPHIFESFSEKLTSNDLTRLTKHFSSTFGFSNDILVSCYIQFLLRPTKIQAPLFSTRSKASMALTERLVLSSLEEIKCPTKKAGVLRKCLLKLESSRLADKDYELYELVLSTYQSMLHNLLDDEVAFRNAPSAPYENELKLVVQRIDVISVLSSFYSTADVGSRPSFAAFFRPLPRQPDSNEVFPSIGDDILYWEKLDSTQIDPMAPIVHSLLQYDFTSISTLSPLACSLSLPSGSIAARHLTTRFLDCKRRGVELPSFENDVAPVIKKIPNVRNRRILVEWCLSRYETDEEKFKCLEIISSCATQESHDAEKQQCGSNTTALKETEAREFMKQAVASRDCFAHKLRVKSILRADLQANSFVGRAVLLLVTELDKKAASSTGLNPEVLIDFLLRQGSQIACDQVLGEMLPIPHVREFGSLVHKACCFVAEQHSHIDPWQTARAMAHNWLFYGEPTDVVDSKTEAMGGISPNIERDRHNDEDETTSFVMDLSKLQPSDQWHVQGDGAALARLPSIEEHSAVQPCSSREQSEEGSKRTAIRVAFLLGFSSPPSSSIVPEEKENKKSNASSEFSQPIKVVGRTALKKKSKTDEDTRQLCSYLLGIVFASTKALQLENVTARNNSGRTGRFRVPSTITFAMRHRALRVASILCPQSLLEEVAALEGFITDSDVPKCSLKMCSFGIFIAKEMEEMGLSLPHPNLKQLSTMNFLSNAKALWRRHRNDSFESKGRFLLLLVEMSLRGGETDYTFLNDLLIEVVRFSLPRTMLLALEGLAESRHRRNKHMLTICKQGLAQIGDQIEVHLNSSVTPQPQTVVSTLLRFAKLVSILCEESDKKVFYSKFNRQVGVMTVDGNPPCKLLAKILATIGAEQL